MSASSGLRALADSFRAAGAQAEVAISHVVHAAAADVENDTKSLTSAVIITYPGTLTAKVEGKGVGSTDLHASAATVAAGAADAGARKALGK